MIMVNTAYPKRFTKTTGGLPQLKEAIQQKQELKKFEPVILKALQGRYSGAKQMRADLLDLMVEKRDVPEQIKPRGTKPDPTQLKYTDVKNTKGNQTVPLSRQSYRRNKKKSSWMEFLFIIIVLGVLYAWYTFNNLP
jgi:serine/threonine-protein kinase